MTGLQLFAAAVGIGLLVAVFVGVAVSLWPARLPDGRSVEEISQRVRRERSGMDSPVRPTGFQHEAPEHVMGVMEAQMTMQQHRACRVGECPRKSTAWQALVEAGRIRPDAGRRR
ncbi:hypothetical protein IU486_09360 [Streptomyces gardneri]|uniref:hypothetical protein n=1 Tax=Nocardia sputi TaxID=2943705 RepID=UPI00189537FC|nr:hypothetical protein [Nocardia sputi]MBF6164979.1 hypothetical protein [Streptomyces gardneri]MBF6206586.1 hypothetical protein [Streptomyces gardneri]